MTTSAHWRGEKHMNKTEITASQGTTAPKYGKTAAGLLEAARMFYQDPENEKAFQEWKKTQKGGKSE